MASTEKTLPAGMMPGKEEQELYAKKYEDPSFTLADVIEGFDSFSLDQKGRETFLRRYPWETGVGYKGEWALEPVKRRYEFMRLFREEPIRELKYQEDRFRREGSESAYKAVRKAFSTAIGKKVCLDVLKAEAESITEAENRKQEEEYERSEAKRQEDRDRRERIYDLIDSDPDFFRNMGSYDLDEEDRAAAYDILRKWRAAQYDEPMVQVQKLKMVRKKLKLNQRDFAKRIGYPINKYPELEKGKIRDYRFNNLELARNPEELEWFMHLLAQTGANPHWLLDDREDSIYDVEEDEVLGVAEPDLWRVPMFATEEEIRKWHQEIMELVEAVRKIREEVWGED